MASDARVRLLEVDPDLARFLRDDERADVRALTLPVVRVTKDEPDVDASVAASHGFGALVLEGMLVQRLQLGEQETMRLIGPGDVIGVGPTRPSTLVAGFGRQVIADTRLAILGHEFLSAARRWPGLMAGLHVHTAEQADRVSAQVAICQLPRVADRLLAMMWLLAESWGRVTSAGVTLPLVLTHEALGALVGARRPTVSLALAELTDRGAVVRQQTGWLLLEDLPDAAPRPEHREPPVLLAHGESTWAAPPAPPAPARIGEALHETVQRLREDVARAREETSTTMAEVRSTRERVTRRRAQLAQEAISRPRAPSSG